MKRIGIRELRQRASDYVRLAERGEQIEITDRGRPVALLVPVPQGSTRERLIAEGRLKSAAVTRCASGHHLPPLLGSRR